MRQVHQLGPGWKSNRLITLHSLYYLHTLRAVNTGFWRNQNTARKWWNLKALISVPPFWTHNFIKLASKWTSYNSRVNRNGVTARTTGPALSRLVICNRKYCKPPKINKYPANSWMKLIIQRTVAATYFSVCPPQDFHHKLHMKASQWLRYQPLYSKPFRSLQHLLHFKRSKDVF